MQVIKKVFYSVLMLLAFTSVKAQEINYALNIHKATCNTTNDGSLEISVLATNPPYTYQWNFGATTASVNNLPVGNYTVQVSDGLGNDTLVVIQLRALHGVCGVTSALAFTPNGDLINDTWQIDNIQYYPNNKILVFNRWGQKVYEHSGEYVPWDGTDLLGNPVPDNAYFFIIYTDKNDESSLVKGSVSIIR